MGFVLQGFEDPGSTCGVAISEIFLKGSGGLMDLFDFKSLKV